MTEELWPGQRVSRASYVVSMLQPEGRRRPRADALRLRPDPARPAVRDVRRRRQPDPAAQRRRRSPTSRSRASRARTPTRCRRFDALFEQAARLPAPADAAPAAGARAPSAPATCFELLREAGRAAGHEPPRPARPLPDHDDVGRRPARRLVRERRAQGRLRLDRRRRRLGRARTRRAPRTTCCTTRSASSTACRAPGATCAAAWARSPRRSPPARAPPARRSAPSAPVASIDVAGGRVDRRHARQRRDAARAARALRRAPEAHACSTSSAPSTSPTRSREDMRRYRTRGGSVKINAVLSEPPRYVNAPDDVSEQLLHASVAICPSIAYLERAWQDAQRGVPGRGPVHRGRGADGGRPVADRRRHDGADDVHPVRPAREPRTGPTARARPTRSAASTCSPSTRRTCPTRSCTTRCSRRRTSSGSSAWRAARSSRASRASTRWRSCARRRELSRYATPGPRPLPVRGRHAPGRRRDRGLGPQRRAARAARPARGAHPARLRHPVAAVRG